MKEAEADAIKMLSKTTEAVEAPMPTETREGAINTKEGFLKTAAEAHKRLDMVSEELNLMESESGVFNRIIQGVVETVAEITEERSGKMKTLEADAFKMMSTMEEAAEVPTTRDMREGALKMVAEAPKKLETAAGELNLTGLADLTLFTTGDASAAPSSASYSAMNRSSYDSISGIK